MSMQFFADANTEFMAATLSCIGDGVIVTSLEGLVLFMNNAAETIIGWKCGEVEGMQYKAVIPMVDAETCMEIESPVAACIHTGSITGLKRNTLIMTRSGEKKFVSATCSPIRDRNGKIEGVVMVFRDISRIKALEARNIGERDSFRTIFNSAPVSMLILNGDAEITQVNKAALKLFEKESSHVIGKSFGNGLCCKGSFADERGCGYGERCQQCELRKAILEACEGRTISEFEINKSYINNETEKNFWFTVNVSPLILDDKKHIIVAMSDITDRKVSEMELKRTKEEAELASRAKGEFLANMSHEIRTPINGILGMIDLTLLSELSQEQKENMIVAKKCAGSLLKIINDILDFSKIEAGKLVIENIDFDIRSLLDDITKVHSPRAGKKGLELTYTISSNIPQYLNGDPGRLQQILNNLLNNALKFTDAGEISVTVKKNEITSEYIELKFIVSDTGIGISHENIERLFKSFSQIDSSYTRKFNGTGLGLVICRQIVEMMGGKMWVESEMGKGSKFFFNIRLKVGNKPVERVLINPEAVRNSRVLEILLVEDDNINQIVLRGMLKEKGHNIDIANNGIEALEYHERKRYDLILMDIQMPQMDGIEATGIIREREGDLRHTPVIALTAFALQGDRERFLSKGMDEYIPKPVKMEELIFIIDKVIEHNLPIEPDYNERVKLDINGEIVFIHETLLKSGEELRPILEEISALVNKLMSGMEYTDISLVEMSAHKLKELFNQIDAEELKGKAFKIELAARRENIKEAIGYVTQLYNEFETYKRSFNL